VDERRLLVIADVSPLEVHGGAARVVREQCARLADRGHAVTAFCRDPGGGVPRETRVGRARVVHYPVSRAHPLAFAVTSIVGARRHFRQAVAPPDRWDAVLFHQPFSASALAPRLAATGQRVYVFHSPAGTEYRLRAERPGHGRRPIGARLIAAVLARLERRALRAATAVVVLSEFSRDLLARAHAGLPAPVTTIPGAVDLQRFRPPGDRHAVRVRLGLSADSPLLLTVRDLQPRMGLDVLLQALALLGRERSVGCVIGGSGVLRPALEDLAGRLALTGVARFAGHIPEDTLPLHYQAADLFVLPTRALEGFGLVTVEALACGTPVVATRVGATPEILGPLDERLLAESASAEGLAAAIRRALPLSADEAFRRRCRAHAEGRYSWDRHLDALEGLLG
jgi:glycosyltransferase involved in cell wall biosynthesis